MNGTASRSGASSANTPPPSRRARTSAWKGELRSREYESQGAKVRTYDIVAISILNLRAGQRNAATAPEEAAA